MRWYEIIQALEETTNITMENTTLQEAIRQTIYRDAYLAIHKACESWAQTAFKLLGTKYTNIIQYIENRNNLDMADYKNYDKESDRLLNLAGKEFDNFWYDENKSQERKTIIDSLKELLEKNSNGFYQTTCGNNLW